MILATAETPNFTFQVLAETIPTARAHLLAAWMRHARATGADPDYFLADDINYQEMIPGVPTRDGSPI